MLPPAFDVDRAMADVHHLVEELGPRPAGSTQEEAASRYVHDQLGHHGWTPFQRWRHPNMIACKGDGRRVFIAHVDSVPGSPGAVDNAAGVATLLELGRTTQATDLCLLFVGAEEIGLKGSRELAESLPVRDGYSWHPDPDAIELVVALDLVGHPGRLSATGLGRHWDGPALQWFLAHTDVDVPYAYRAVSRALPRMERSDHFFFQEAGLRAVHLLHRGEGGVFPRYHQPEDTEADPQAILEVADALESLATAPSPPPLGEDAAVVSMGQVLPAWLVNLTFGASILAGVGTWVRGGWRETGGQLLRAVLALVLGVVSGRLLLAISPFAPTVAEQTATRVMGEMGIGWWAMAPVITGVFVGSVVLVRTLLGARGSAPFLAAVLAAAAWRVDPTIAFPLAVSALLALAHPLLALAGPMLLLRPDALRELAFHGLLPPSLWPVLMVLALPAIGRYGSGWRRQGPSGAPGPSGDES